MKWYYKYLPVNESGNFDISAYFERTAHNEHNIWMPILILICILAMWAICKFVRQLKAHGWHNDNRLLKGNMLIGNAILVVITNLLIIGYVLSSGTSALWFILPDEEGNWIRSIICGIVYLYVLINLLVGFLKTMDDFCDGINLKKGIIALGIGIIALVVCAVSYPDILIYAVIVLMLPQLIQLGVIFNKSIDKGLTYALAACGIYIVGALGLITVAAPFVLLVIVLTIVAFIFAFLLKYSMEEDKKRDVIIYDDGRIVDKYDGTVYEKDANGNISPKY